MMHEWKKKMQEENWYYKPSCSGNSYFYPHIVECLVGYLLIYGTINMIFPNHNNIVNISVWGLAISLALHIFRWYSYRYKPRRIKSAIPLMYFVFIWLCIVLYLDEWNLRRIYTDSWIILACAFLIPSLFLYWIWQKNKDDRLIILWLFGAK